MDVASELASNDKLNIQDVQQAEGHSIESLLDNVDVSESIAGDHTIQEMGSQSRDQIARDAEDDDSGDDSDPDVASELNSPMGNLHNA